MKNNWKTILTISIIIGGFLSLFASASPDGLEKVAEEFGFLEKGNNFISGIMPDYLFPGVMSEKIATALAGIIGTLLVFLILFGAGKVLYKKSN